MADEEDFKTANLAPFYTNRAIENLKYDFDVKVTLENEALAPLADPVTAQSFTEVEEATWQDAVKKFQKGKHSKAREHICSVLFERGSHGVDLVDLKVSNKTLMKFFYFFLFCDLFTDTVY